MFGGVHDKEGDEEEPEDSDDEGLEDSGSKDKALIDWSSQANIFKIHLVKIKIAKIIIWNK